MVWSSEGFTKNVNTRSRISGGNNGVLSEEPRGGSIFVPPPPALPGMSAILKTLAYYLIIDKY
ncbi:MAG: hypothetical protein SP1CHLAM9_12040 [Chlamydiia bacterium]|nr:hypothetical protein [Chlamydiia bacterium]MCH9624835.1 hypothetical protein [Chlamydiia bacterium]